MSAEATPPIPCSAIVFRAVFKKTFDADTGQANADAFKLRVTDLEDGLSVGRSAAAASGKLSKVVGTASIHVGRLRDAGLDVVTDPKDDSHAFVTGLPDPDGPDYLTAERLAERIKNLSRFSRIAQVPGRPVTL